MTGAEHKPLCDCGCGRAVREGKRFVRGHWSRSPEARVVATARRQRSVQNPNLTGLCACGCGAQTPLAGENHPERGYYKGQPLRFVPGHHVKKGAASHKWRGGRWVHPSGYVWIYAPDHPHRNAKGYVYEHRLVIEHRIGRILEPAERVHHVNRDRGDNRDENLVLFPSQTAHMRECEHHPPTQTKEQRSMAGKKGAAVRWRK